MKERLSIAFALIATLCALAATVSAQETPPADPITAQQLVEDGIAAYEDGDCRMALDLLREAVHTDPGSIDVNYQTGIIAYNCDEYEEALFAFDRVLAIDPLHGMARYQKARAQLALGDIPQAEAALEDMLETELPGDVRSHVECLLASLCPARCHDYSGFVSLAHTWDSNVTLGTRGSVPLGPSLVSNPTQRSDNIRTVTAVVAHSYPLATEGLTWGNTLIAYISDNDRVNTNDLALFGLTTALAYCCNDWTYGASVAWSNIRLDEHTYQNNWRFGFRAAYSWCDWIFDGAYAWTKRHHFNRNAGFPQTYGQVHQFIFGSTYCITACSSARLEYIHFFDKTPMNSTTPLSYYRNEVSLTYDYKFHPCWKATLKGAYREDDYRNHHAIFTTLKREDETLIGTATLSYLVSEHFSIAASFENIHNESNININEYDARRLTVTMAAPF